MTRLVLSKTESGSVERGGSAEGGGRPVLGEDMQMGGMGGQCGRGSLRDHRGPQILAAKLRS